MHQSLARYSAPVSLVHAPSWADFITAMVGFKVFGTHRRGRRQQPFAKFILAISSVALVDEAHLPPFSALELCEPGILNKAATWLKESGGAGSKDVNVGVLRTTTSGKR
jgi:hypothetical protein